VRNFPAEQQPAVRALLGALVSSSGVKQRLALDDLARATDLEAEEAGTILEKLTRQRLVQRYEVAGENSIDTRLEYELTHDYLVPRIARWLGDDFWNAQKAREILRQALPEWESRGRLLSPDDLRFVAAQQGRVRFSDAEVELLYAAAVSFDDRPGDWQVSLSDAACQRILLRLLQHPEIFARRQATLNLAGFPGDDVSSALAQAALSDPAPTVREAAAQAIAQPAGSNGEVIDRAAVVQLTEATTDPATADAALQALVTVRDLQPASQSLLPADLRGSIRRRVWARRWQRNWHQVLTTTLQGMQGGFWGLGLGMGLFLGLYDVSSRGQDQIRWQAVVSLMSLGIPLAGVIGILAVGGGAFVGVALRSLQDRELPLRTWAVTTLVSAGLFSLGLLFLGAISFGNLSSGRTVAAGLLIGLGLAGVATAPLKLAGPLRLGLAALVGIAMFVLVGRLGLFFNRSSWWLLVMGGASGMGFSLGLSHSRLDAHEVVSGLASP
jgi:hypothetical protein